MANRNCPNCSAPYDVALSKCPYCGTSYFDMSAIDIGSGQPLYIKLKCGNTVVTSKVIAHPSINIHKYSDDVCIRNYCGDVVGVYQTNTGFDIEVTFKSVSEANKPNEPLITVERLDDAEED